MASIHTAGAKDLPQRHYLSLDAAQQVLDAAKAFAVESKGPSVIAVVDSAGNLVVFARMDGVRVNASVDLAPEKARSAALLGRPTRDFEDAINSGTRPAVATAHGFVMMTGGVPIKYQDEIIGAIGVSGGSPDHDEEVANAGAAALK